MIDTDELKKNIDEKIGDFPHRKMLFNVIDNQPTAYGIDKVVEQLEETFDRWGLDEGKKEIMRAIVKGGVK